MIWFRLHSPTASVAEFDGAVLVFSLVASLSMVSPTLPGQQLCRFEFLWDGEDERVGCSRLLQKWSEEGRSRLGGSHVGTTATQPLPTGEVPGVNWGVTGEEEEERDERASVEVVYR